MANTRESASFGPKEELRAAIGKVSTCYMVLMIIFTIAYLIELFKGARTIGYIVVFLLIGWIPFAIGKYISTQLDNWELAKWIYVVGYTVLYIFALLTGRTTTYVYLLPMMFVFMLTSDVKLMMIVDGMAVIANIISVVVSYMSTEDKSGFLADAEIQVLVIIVCAIFAVITVKFLKSNNERKLQESEESASRISKMMDQVSSMVDEAKGRLEISDNHAKEVDSNISSCEEAMSELAKGAEMVANTSESQLVATKEMFSTIEELQQIAVRSANDMESVSSDINTCIGAKDSLVAGITSVNKKAISVEERARKLSSTAETMNDIIEMINEVASQTQLLSLNASIEAARAGDAGRGFAVVAGEIGSLVEQTTTATAKISDKVSEIRSEIETVVSDISEIRNEVNAQADNSIEMGKRFDEMAVQVKEVRNGIKQQTEAVDIIYASGTNISESISTLSGVSEETTASAEQTLRMLHTSAEAIDDLTRELSALNELMKK
ncbi:MAG: hypothetical protein J5824_01530 [Lachnospiraceae bacterium]|nr:hypothetical protein [Lachnospiraceae bacterium]